MTAELLKQLETLLGKPVPQDYVAFLDRYPESLVHARRAIDDSNDEGTVADVELLADLPSVLEINLEARRDSVPEPDGLEFFWPEQFLVIGETGGGDYYCIDVNGEVPGVMQYNHMEVGFEVVADSLDEFTEMLVETFILECPFEDVDEISGKAVEDKADQEPGN